MSRNFRLAQCPMRTFVYLTSSLIIAFSLLSSFHDLTSNAKMKASVNSLYFGSMIYQLMAIHFNVFLMGTSFLERNERFWVSHKEGIEKHDLFQ